MNQKQEDWMGAGQRWLIEKSNEIFAAWLESKDGKRWKKQNPFSHKKSVYNYGFRLPDWHRSAMEALKEGDEHEFKAIKLQNLNSLYRL